MTDQQTQPPPPVAQVRQKNLRRVAASKAIAEWTRQVPVVHMADGKDISYWPSITDFQEPARTLRWRELPREIFKIISINDHGMGSFGPSVVLELENYDGETLFVWAAISVVYALRRRKNTKFIYNLGLKASERADTFYYDFKLH